jgi:hypothetical protein
LADERPKPIPALHRAGRGGEGESIMNSMKTVEKRPFEELLEMSGGYVLDFRNDTFAAFFAESVGKDTLVELIQL